MSGIWNSSGPIGGKNWYATYSVGQPQSFRLTVKNSLSANSLATLTYISNNSYTFYSDKTYQIVTNLWGYMNASNPTAASFSISAAGWTEFLDFNQTKGTTPSRFANTSGSANVTNRWPGVTNSNLYFYGRPIETISTRNIVTYTANRGFGQTIGNSAEGITKFELNEMPYIIQGFAFYKYPGKLFNPLNPSFPTDPINSLGWLYEPDYQGLEVLNWYDHSQVQYYPVGGSRTTKRADFGYRQNNYIARYVPYSFFNLKFNYESEANFPLQIWLSNSLPNINPGSYSMPPESILVCTLTQSAPIQHSFYSLQGLRYLIFKGAYVGTGSSTFSNAFISDMKVDGGYHPGNNRQYLTTNTNQFSNPTTLEPIGLTAATFSTLVGNGNTVNATSSLTISEINANIGNGLFKAGIWENGVWNSGWRVDDSYYEFYDIFQFIVYRKNKRWRIEITGPESSVSKFEVGDKVAIGNIVAIDINEERKLFRNYFDIISVTNTTIVVEIDNEFPLRRIEKDSPAHRIYITKNVWLSGAFLNGYFKGVWNNGLFKGYPLITEMYDTHWVDGTFDGGHFSSSTYQIPKFVDTIFYALKRGGKVGLTFSQKHRLAVGDTITIDKDDKSINPQYDSETTVDRVVNEYHIVTGLDWGQDSVLESGTVSIVLQTGLIQKIDFKSNNQSNITSNKSLESSLVFQYSSWMDVNYDSTSAVNIGKPVTLVNSLSERDYSENNLYGYPTNDILQSKSTFRNSYSLRDNIYSLGTKYKSFSDYIGEAGQFERGFDSSPRGVNRFLSFGWTFSKYAPASITFSRTTDEGDSLITGNELLVQAIGRGGILDIYPLETGEEIIGRTNDTIVKNRYTTIEFDLITFSSVNSVLYESSIPGLSVVTKAGLFTKGSSKGTFPVPQIHFNNINKISRNVYYGSVIGTSSTLYDATFLPVYRNVNHLSTPKTKKIEYFFNKRNLSMHFLGNYYYFTIQPDGTLLTTFTDITSRFIIDNLKFYETDMIPFFKYFEDVNINKGIQVPYQGVAPFIDYSDENFDFVDNLSLGFDSVTIESSSVPAGGVGISIGAPSTTGGIFNVSVETSTTFE